MVPTPSVKTKPTTEYPTTLQADKISKQMNQFGEWNARHMFSKASHLLPPDDTRRFEDRIAYKREQENEQVHQDVPHRDEDEKRPPPSAI